MAMATLRSASFRHKWRFCRRRQNVPGPWARSTPRFERVDRTQPFAFPDESNAASCRVTTRGIARVGMMKRYLVFTYYVGRSCGGMKDLLDSFDSVAEALENLLSEPTRYFQIVDRETLKVVKEGLTMFKDYDPEFFSRE
jgi:hypothetical protein